MYPLSSDEQPEVPNHHRIFAAAAELEAAYTAGEEFTKGQPLSEAMVVLTLTAVDDIVDDLIEAWRTGPTRPSHLPPGYQPIAPFPDIDDLKRAMLVMVTREDRAERGLPPERTPDE